MDLKLYLQELSGTGRFTCKSLDRMNPNMTYSYLNIYSLARICSLLSRSDFFPVRKLRSFCNSHSLGHYKEIDSLENETKQSFASANVISHAETGCLVTNDTWKIGK